MQAAIYCRVSTHDQNCDRQERDLLAFADRLNYEVAATFRETASGARVDRAERKKVMALAQRRDINVVLVTELSRWGRSLPDLIHTLQELQGFGVSVLAESGIQFDLNTPHGKLLAGVLGSLSEFERDLIRERVCSGLAVARSRGKTLGRRKGFCPTDKLAAEVLALRAQGQKYRSIAHRLGISRNSAMAIVRRSS